MALKRLGAVLASLFLVLALAQAVPGDPDFLLGTWTSEGVCRRGEVYSKEGERYIARSQGRTYFGTITANEHGFTTRFASSDGLTKEFDLEVINENRLRLLSALLCDKSVGQFNLNRFVTEAFARPDNCQLWKLEHIEFYFQRCAE